MSASNQIGDRLIAAAQVAGVLATAWLVWTQNILPRLGLQSLASIIAEAFLWVALAWICGALTTFWVYFVVSLAGLNAAARFSLRNSAPAMWFAPAIVLLSTPFPQAFAVSLLFIANATRQLIAQWGIIESPIHTPQTAHAEPALLFAPGPPEAVFSTNYAPVLMASLSAQAGAVALLWHHPFRAAALFAVSTAILTSLSIATGAYRPGRAPQLPHSALSVVMTFLLAATFTFGGIAVRGGRGVAAAAPSSGSGSGSSAPLPANQELPAAFEDSTAFGGDYPGVILLPELKSYPTLFVPVRAAPARFGAPMVQSVGIPFSGAYWMFRFPASRPPRRSIVRRGSALDLSFHTTDGWPLEMEAHQKLEQPISARCCSQIQLAIRTADPYPATVSLELILIDTMAPMWLTQTLGTAAPAGTSPAGQVLTFRVPSFPAISQFDELKVVFHRPVRSDRSAKIAIDRFILVP